MLDRFKAATPFEAKQFFPLANVAIFTGSILFCWLLGRFHHYETTNPISLFLLHSLEVAELGGLMIAFPVVYPMTVGRVVAYLSLNVLFGTLGHSGVETFPRNLR